MASAMIAKIPLPLSRHIAADVPAITPSPGSLVRQPGLNYISGPEELRFAVGHTGLSASPPLELIGGS